MTDKLDKLHEEGERLLKLRRTLQAREGRPEYKDSVEEIKKQIARLENRPTGQDQ